MYQLLRIRHKLQVCTRISWTAGTTRTSSIADGGGAATTATKLRNQETCCPCYTIKCNGLEFKLSKSNKRILRRINRFLRDGKRESKPEAGDGDGEADADYAIVAPEVTASEPQPQLPDKSPPVINVEQVASLATAQKKPTKQATAAAVEAPTLGSNKCAYAP